MDQRRGFTCKLLQFLPNKHMVKKIMKLYQTNVSFLLPADEIKQSRLRRLKNNVHQRLVLNPFFLSSISKSVFHNLQKIFYANYCTLLHSSKNWKDLKRILIHLFLSFLFYLFYLYIHPPDSQESDGGANA